MPSNWVVYAAAQVVIVVGWIGYTLRSDGSPAPQNADQTRALLLTVGAMELAVLALEYWTLVLTEPLTVVVDTASDGPFLALGVATGLALGVLNLGLVPVLERLGLAHDERFMLALTPQTPVNWVLLVVVMVPVAVVEEFLFRGVLVGAFAAGFGVSPWVLVLPAGLAFGALHSGQGEAGVVATTVLGLGFGLAYVLTGSLLLVVVAHYVANLASITYTAHERPAGFLAAR